MELFFHGLDEVVSQFQDKVVCGGWGFWDKVETKVNTSVSMGDS